MGNGQSSNRKLWWKLNFVLPESHRKDSDTGEKYFPDEKDREQFICTTFQTHIPNPSTATSNRTTDAIITVITRNGALDLSGYDFRLLYSRRENDRVVARIVAEKEGIIAAKVEPETDGETQLQAFRALRKDVEIKLDRILEEVPSSGEAVAVLEGGAAGEPSKLRRAAPPAIPHAIRDDEEDLLTGRRGSVERRQGVAVPVDAPPAYYGSDVKVSGKKG
jgi:hypothetical protein